ncbi:MAG: sulfurtransferase complex subunit TusC [Methylovulum sp.]|nr:sulfurtransferase complex subunit TusC [Methylovulum sp.]
MKNYLFVLRKPAHSGALVQEMLDIILTTVAFDQQVSILLLDDGVFHLKNNQHAEHLATKDTAAMFKALELYEVYAVYIEEESLAERGLTQQDLFLRPELVPRGQISALMAQNDVIFAG